MTVLSSRDCALSVGGTPVSMADEPTTDLGAHTAYQITADSKRAIDPGSAITVKVNGSAVGSTTYAVDYAHGVVTFASAQNPAHAVVVSGKYVPLLALAETRSARIVRPHPVMADSTRLGDTATRQTEIARRCTVTLEHLTTSGTDLGDATSLAALYAGGLLFLQAVLGTGDGTLRGWFCPTSATPVHSLDDLLVTTVELVGVVQTCVGRPVTDQAVFSIR